ncbi:MAG: glycosyltransferase family 4 protein [Candidatus Sericytochromatia bacterium]|nr:glycosyltransferase family 4 protein [Candidatus Sericytochromatia bacterium]
MVGSSGNFRAIAPGPSAGPGPLRVLMIGHEWFEERPGGAGRYMGVVARGLAARGHHVTVLVPRGSAPAPERAVRDGFTLLRPALGRGALGWVAAMAVRLGAVLAREGPFDVVHSHFAPAGLVPLWHPALGQARRVTQFQGPWADESRLEGAGALSATARRGVERLAYARSHRCVVLSEAFGRLLADRYGVPAAQIDVVPAGVDLAAFRPASDREGLRRTLGLGPGPEVVVARRLVARMGLGLLLEAWPAVLAARPEARLTIVGEGPLRPELEAQVATAGLGGSVSLVGRLADEALVARYQAADLAVLPTIGLEGFGLATVEALACGTPVIGTDAGATPEVLAPLEPTLVVPAGDAGSLAGRMVEALTGARPLPTREACRAHAEARYGWPRALDGLEAVLARA